MPLPGNIYWPSTPYARLYGRQEQYSDRLDVCVSHAGRPDRHQVYRLQRTMKMKLGEIFCE